MYLIVPNDLENDVIKLRNNIIKSNIIKSNIIKPVMFF